MKKFYAFAAAAALAVSANAQSLYMTGASAAAEDGGLPAQWAPTNPAEFEIVDGKYQITVAGLTQFKVSTALGVATDDDPDGWVAFNAAALTCEYGEEAGKTVELTPGDANIMCPWKGEWTVVVAADLSNITMTTTTPKPDDSKIEIYLRGDMNGWCNEEADRPAWMLQQINPTVFKFEFAADQKIQVGETFKIADADWNKYNIGGNGEAIILDTDTEVFNGGNPANLSLEEECNGVMWLTLDYEGSAYVVFSNDKTFVPEWAGGSDAVSTIEVSNGEAQYFNLQGVRVANPENGLYIVVKDGKSYKTILK